MSVIFTNLLTLNFLTHNFHAHLCLVNSTLQIAEQGNTSVIFSRSFFNNLHLEKSTVLNLRFTCTGVRLEASPSELCRRKWSVLKLLTLNF